MLFFFLMWLWFGQKPEAVKVQVLEPAGQIRRIVIDAGHGGKDSGAIYSAGLLEKDITLDVARKVREALLGSGLRVIMTRDTDIFIPLPNRAKVSQKKQADLFVSIHANASPSKSLNGLEVYSLSELSREKLPPVSDIQGVPSGLQDLPEIYLDASLKRMLWLLKMTQDRVQSALLARWIADTVAHSVPVEAHRVKEANFYVLKWAQCPAVLVEMGYGTNHQDENKLRSPHYRKRLAGAIVNGILDFKKQYERTQGFTV